MELSNHQNSDFYTPLNEVLGYKAHILILRSLWEAGVSMSHAELVRRTGISPPGIHKAVKRLGAKGVLEYTGSGRQLQVGIRNSYPLSGAIRGLFQAENRRHEEFISDLKKIIQLLDEQPMSVWVYGKFARGGDEYGDPIQIAVLGSVKSTDTLAEALRKQITDADLESLYDLTIGVTGLTRADLEFQPELLQGELILLWGASPNSFVPGYREKPGNISTHQDLDSRSRKYARAWAELLKHNPEVIDRTRDYLRQMIRDIQTGDKNELEEWLHILETMPYQRLRKFLLSDSERSTQLRQSMPFWPVLRERERDALMSRLPSVNKM